MKNCLINTEQSLNSADDRREESPSEQKKAVALPHSFDCA